MGLHHVATVGLAVLSLLSLILFRAIGPPPRPSSPSHRLLPTLSRSTTTTTPHRLLPPPANSTAAAAAAAAHPPKRTPRSFRLPWPTTLAVGALWAIKIRKPQWGENPISYDVSRELVAFTPGTEGLGAFLFFTRPFLGSIAIRCALTSHTLC